MSYLSNPRKGRDDKKLSKFEVYDLNSIAKNFPAADVMAMKGAGVKKQHKMLQLKAHLQSTPKERASQFEGDLKELPKKAAILSKKVHFDEDKGSTYGNALRKAMRDHQLLKNPNVKRLYTTKKGEDIEGQRDSLSEHLERTIEYPVSPSTAELINNPRVVPLPFHTEEVRKIIARIPSTPVKERKKKSDDDKDGDYIP